MRIKAPKIEIGQGSRPCGATLYQKVEIFDIFGAAFPPPLAIEVKFCTGKRTQVPVGPAKFDLNRCKESPLRSEKPDFWPVSKNNTGSLPLRGILPVKKHHIFAPTAGARCTIIPRLCMVIELVVPIKQDVIHFSIHRIVFPTGCMEKFGLIYRRAVSSQ